MTEKKAAMRRLFPECGRSLMPLLALLIIVLTAYPVIAGAESSTNSSALVVGIRHDDHPLQSMDDGWPSGFDVELVRLLAEKTGLNTVFRVDTRTRLWQELRNGNIDIIADMLAIDSDDSVIPLEPVCRLAYFLYVPESSTITGIGDLAGRDLIVVDSFPLRVLEKKMITPASVISVAHVNDALKFLIRSHYDAALLSLSAAESALLDMNIEGVRRLEGAVWEEDYGYLLSPKSKALAAPLSEALAEMRAQGRIDKLSERWLMGYQKQAIWRTAKYLLFGIVLLAILLLVSLMLSAGLRRQVQERTRELEAKLTELRQREQENQELLSQMQHTQKLEGMGVLAGGIAHDFNNLLMGMLGNADLALDQLQTGSPARKELNEIQTGIRRAADLCRQMLAYSGKGSFIIEPVDLNQLVEEMASLLSVSVSKRAELRYSFAEKLPLINADSTQLRQVVMNLITNASDAMVGQDGVISISTGIKECDTAFLKSSYVDDNLPAGNYVYVEVADNGCGMSKSTLDKLFDPFFTTKTTGRGLGLAAVLGIIRSHSGAVMVSSTEGVGTTFAIYFPVAEEQTAMQKKHGFDWKKWRGEGTVLLVDDEQTVRNVGQRMLERVGFSVVTAEDGVQAMQYFKKEHNNLRCVILDMSMPHMDGEETFAAIRKTAPDMPVILSSGYNRQSVVSRFTCSSPVGFLQKPYQLERMVHELQQLLSL